MRREYSKAELERGEALLLEFDRLADQKYQYRASRYGLTVGDTPLESVVGHLVEELVELLYAMFPDLSLDGAVNWFTERVQMVLRQRMGTVMGKDIATELFDIRNLARLAYVCGKVQDRI